MKTLQDRIVIALVIGNSRLHWGCFKDGNLIQTWDTCHLKEPVNNHQLPTHLFPVTIAQLVTKTTLIYIVSVAEEQTQLWKAYPHQKNITLKDIPLTNTYSTLGSDRAICVYGAGETYGYPALVIDGGTALTYTAVGNKRNFLGGAILPGFSLQLTSLAQQTSHLPAIILPKTLPQQWATNTTEAIASGVIHSILTGINNYVTAWWEQYPGGIVLLTGGDAILLDNYLQQKYPTLAKKIIVDKTLMFQGISQMIINN